MDLKKRTKAFALNIIKLVSSLPNTKPANVISHQILRSGTSVGANYRAVTRANSDKDFIHKLKICEEECDETTYWLELIEESGLIINEVTNSLKKESDELTSFFVASINTKRTNMNRT